MSDDNSPQYAMIEQPLGTDPQQVYCPICGNAAVDKDGEAGKCPHLAFVYPGLAAEFIYESAKFQQNTASLDKSEVTFETFREFLKSAGYGKRLLAIEVTYSGLACGPVRYTDIYGFDYDTLSN